MVIREVVIDYYIHRFTVNVEFDSVGSGLCDAFREEHVFNTMRVFRDGA